MIRIETNWDSVKQDMIDDVSEFISEIREKALSDIKDKLVEKGIDGGDLKISKSNIVFITDDDQDYENGQVYFNEVDEEISESNWLETL